MHPTRRPHALPRPTLRLPRLAGIAACLAGFAAHASPNLSAGVQGSVFNTNYQKSGSGSATASAQDARHEELFAVDGLHAGTTDSVASALAEPGNLHLYLDANSTATHATDTFWGHPANAIGNAGMEDTFHVNLPGAANGTTVDVLLVLDVEAFVTSDYGGAFLQASAAVRTASDILAEVQYENNGGAVLPAGLTVDRQTPVPTIRYGQDSVVVHLRTGIVYVLDAAIQGRVDAASDINPGLDPTARVPSARATVNAANTAHVGLVPLVPGATVVGSSSAAYGYSGGGPTLLGSASVEGPFVPVDGARVDAVNHEVVAPLADGSAQRFFRLSGWIAWKPASVVVKDGAVHVRY